MRGTTNLAQPSPQTAPSPGERGYVSIPSRAAGCRGHAEGHFLCEQRVYPVATACGNGKRAVSVVLLAAFVTGENDSVYSAFLPRTNRNFQLSQEARKHAHRKNSCFRACLLGTTNLAQPSPQTAPSPWERGLCPIHPGRQIAAGRPRATSCAGSVCTPPLPAARGNGKRAASVVLPAAFVTGENESVHSAFLPRTNRSFQLSQEARRHAHRKNSCFRAYLQGRRTWPSPLRRQRQAPGGNVRQERGAVSQFLDATALPDLPTLARHD